MSDAYTQAMVAQLTAGLKPRSDDWRTAVAKRLMDFKPAPVTTAGAGWGQALAAALSSTAGAYIGHQAEQAETERQDALFGRFERMAREQQARDAADLQTINTPGGGLGGGGLGGGGFGGNAPPPDPGITRRGMGVSAPVTPDTMQAGSAVGTGGNAPDLSQSQGGMTGAAPPVPSAPPGTFRGGAQPAAIRADNATAAGERDAIIAAGLPPQQQAEALRGVSLNRASTLNGIPPNGVGTGQPAWAAGLPPARQGADPFVTTVADTGAGGPSAPAPAQPPQASPPAGATGGGGAGDELARLEDLRRRAAQASAMSGRGPGFKAAADRMTAEANRLEDTIRRRGERQEDWARDDRNRVADWQRQDRNRSEDRQFQANQTASNQALTREGWRANEPMVAVMGDDGKPVLVPRSQAANRQPAPQSPQVSIDQRGAGTYEQEIGKAEAAWRIALEKAGDQAPATIRRLDQFEQALADFRTGAGAQLSITAGQLAARLGIPDTALAQIGIGANQVARGEQIAGLGGQLLLGQLASGTFPTNNFSDADRAALERVNPNIINSPEGNRVLIGVMREGARRDAQVASAWRTWQRENGGSQESLRRFQAEALPGIRDRDVLAPLLNDAAAAAEGAAGPNGQGRATPPATAPRPRARNPRTGETVEFNGTAWEPVR